MGLGLAPHILLALQADAQLANGKPEAALASVAAGLEAVEKAGGAPPLEAELHRLRGEALLAGAGTVSEAETAIEQGIDVARRQNAKSWELRGATSLARLRRQQGRRARLMAPRNSQDFAFCRRATAMACCMAASASPAVPAPPSKAAPLSR